MKRLGGIIYLGLFLCAMTAYGQFSGPPSGQLAATTVPQAQLIQPAELVQMLKATKEERPLLLQVGSFVMFQQAHIPESIYAGPGSQSAGLQMIEKSVAQVAKGRLIIIYCGCCPWNHCPNIGPAYKKLREMGYTNVKALYIARNFGDDWVAKGYPTQKGS
jgi:thiosulfate/3-mercaptopyruvate sulfurtransferase